MLWRHVLQRSIVSGHRTILSMHPRLLESLVSLIVCLLAHNDAPREVVGRTGPGEGAQALCSPRNAISARSRCDVHRPCRVVAKSHPSFYPSERPRVSARTQYAVQSVNAAVSAYEFMYALLALWLADKHLRLLIPISLWIFIRWVLMAAIRSIRRRATGITTLMFAVTVRVAVQPLAGDGFTPAIMCRLGFVQPCSSGANGMAITCGYHRLFAHATLSSPSGAQSAYLLCGAMRSKIARSFGVATHRVHHRDIADPERDRTATP